MRNRIIFVLSAVLAVSAFNASAQLPAGYGIVDSLVFTRTSLVDTTLNGRNVFEILPDGVSVYQSDAVMASVYRRIEDNDMSNFNGYRIRIYFDNSQNAREESSSVMYRFKLKYPDISAYRTFDSPNFKVTVGDFRTRSEALAALKVIQNDFKSAFIVREKFKYPTMYGDSDFRVDTLKVMRRL